MTHVTRNMQCTCIIRNAKCPRSPWHPRRSPIGHASSFQWSEQIPVCMLAKGGPWVSSYSERRSQLPLYFDLFEQTCMDMGCCLFLTGSDLIETDHLRLLIFDLLSHGGKHLEELVTVNRRLGYGSLPPKWRHSRRMRVLCI